MQLWSFESVPEISMPPCTVFYVPETHIMYFIRRCWFLKCSEEIHYVPLGDGDMWYYVPVDDGWEEVLGRNVYFTSQYFSPNAKSDVIIAPPTYQQASMYT